MKSNFFSKILLALKDLFAEKIYEVSPYEVSPLEYAWIESDWSPDSFVKNVNGQEFYLYLSGTRGSFVFDKSNKTAPGVIDRFDIPLLEEDLLYMDKAMERLTKCS